MWVAMESVFTTPLTDEPLGVAESSVSGKNLPN